MLFGVKVGKKDTKKHNKNMPAKKSRDGSREIPGNPGLDPMVPQNNPKTPQIPGLLNLTKALETLHWCLAARWRITSSYPAFRKASPRRGTAKASIGSCSTRLQGQPDGLSLAKLANQNHNEVVPFGMWKKSLSITSIFL